MEKLAPLCNRYLPMLLAILASAFQGCDSGSDSSGGSGFTAKVDGKAWEATPISITAQANAGVPGNVILTGTQTDGPHTLGLILTLYNVRGPGKYSLGVGSSTVGGIGQLGEGTGGGGDANSWITAGTGMDGEAEIISIGGGRIVGTFAYTVEPGKNNTVGGNRVITEGRFDLPLKGTLSILAENIGSKVTAEFNGVPYNAASVSGFLTDFTGGAGVNFSTATSLNALSITLVGVTAPGKFTYSNTAPQRLITAGRNGGTADYCCWGVNAPGDVAEIIVTDLTAKRVKGTFTATLKPQPGKAATKDLVITKGTFDVGIP